jgi:hypothetical protein
VRGEQEVTAKEPELVRDDRLVLSTIVDVEVIDARVDAQLAVRARRAASIAGSGPATWSSPATHTSQGQCSVSAWPIGLNGGPNSQGAETRLRQRESSPMATTCRQPASAPGGRMNAASCG